MRFGDNFYCYNRIMFYIFKVAEIHLHPLQEKAVVCHSPICSTLDKKTAIYTFVNYLRMKTYSDQQIRLMSSGLLLSPK